MTGGALERLIQILARLPGLGPRSARRAALQLVKRREVALLPLVAALEEVARTVRPCRICGNVSEAELCEVCADPERDASQICVVEDVEDLIVAAFNDAKAKVEAHVAEEMSKLTGGLNLPGGMKLPF